jgi:tRNA(Ile)-lysidine synthase
MIIKTLSTFLNNLVNQKKIIIAYSGGVDSHVLLHALASMRKDFPELHLSALHVNHQLQDDADRWSVHCKNICKALNVPLQTIKAEVKPEKGESLEAVARTKRYEIFAERLPENAYLLTAHHQDDQAETVLLQLLRGAGVKGLSAMALQMPFAKGFLARPLLSIGQAEVVEYAEQAALSWVDDHSNHDVAYHRNYLRHTVMPLLKKIRPGAAQAMSRSAQHCSTASALLEEFAADDFKQASITDKCLSAEKLKTLADNRQVNVMRYWLQAQGCVLPSTIKMQHILQDLIASRYDAKPEITWGEVSLRRVKDEIFVVKK